MELGFQRGLDWRALFGRRGFRFFFAAMFISLFGTGMNFAGVTWHVKAVTGSTVSVSLVTVLVTLPGLFVPFFGGVLIDRVDRRYLGITLDILRALVVTVSAVLLATGRGGIGTLYVTMLLLGVGFAIYWATANALVQELVPRSELVGANAAVLIAVQGGMMTAGAVVGFTYDRLGMGGILGIDAVTYLASALCLWGMRSGYHPPAKHTGDEEPVTIEAPLSTAPGEAVLDPIVEPGLVMGFLADLREGLRYLARHPVVLSLGVTYACMMAGVLSGNVLLVALAQDILNTGPSGFGFMQAGWALGAIAGGLGAGILVKRFPPVWVLITALGVLAVGHVLFPYVPGLAVAVVLNGLFGAARALGGVVTQSSIMRTVPRRLMGRVQSAFSVVATMLQVLMSFTLGWLGEHAGIGLAFVILGLLYAGAVVAAVRAKWLVEKPAGGE